MHHSPFKKGLYLSSSLLVSSQLLHAAGFQLQERSTSGLGRAFAGEAAVAEAASAIATNAASMLLLQDEWSFSAGASYINPQIEVSGTFTPAGSPIGFDAKDKGPAQEALVPYAYLSHKFCENWAAGLALHSRFGLSTDYSDSFPATALANRSEITTIYISPKVAYQVNEAWSIGGGFDAIHAEGKLTNSVSTSFDPSGPNIVDVEGDDWAYGFYIGTHYQFSDKSRIGIAYYSEVDLELEGDFDTQFLPFPSGDATVAQEVPQSVELSIYHELNQSWTLHGSFTWTDWSVFEELVIQTDNADFTKEEKWKDAYRIAAGVTYKCNDKGTYRAGFAFDESPVESKNLRTLRIPDSDRYWLSAGTSYNINEQYSVDFGYSYIFAKTVDILESDPVLGTFEGEAEGNVHIVGLSFNGSF
jgi:long-chain fatty acid transport protein